MTQNTNNAIATITNAFAALACISDRYTRERELFSDVEEFQSMCIACFGERAELTANAAGYCDETGAQVLVYE